MSVEQKCPCCDAVLMPCPFCGKPGRVYGSNVVGCSDDMNCGGCVDFGHWCGTEKGIPAVHWVIKAWNRREPTGGTGNE